jgi:hypothetical protein
MITPFQTNQKAIDAGKIVLETNENLVVVLTSIYASNENSIILWIGGYSVNSGDKSFKVLYYSITNDGNDNGSLIFPFGSRQAFQITSQQASVNEIETRNTADIVNELYLIYGYYPNAIILSFDQNQQTEEYFITFFKNTSGNLAFPENNILYTV